MNAAGPGGPAWRRRGAAPLGLAPIVLLVHLGLADRLAPDRLGRGAAADVPARMVVAFVREVQPTPPPAAPPRRLVPRPRLRTPVVPVQALVPVASLPEVPEPEPAASAALAVPAQRPIQATADAEAAEAAPMSAAPAAPEVPAAPGADTFAWPPSTRLSYRLSGHFRGPVEGQARVEWVMRGTRYQVHLDLSVGPWFAPLVTRRLSSDGEVTPDGLEPRRYDEETVAVLREPRRLAIVFEPDRVRLPGGREVPRPGGVQDSASQFVQMIWLVTNRPELLQAGRSIELPLALPRQVDRWVYDVLGPERLATPLGEVDAVRIRPRREARAGGDLTAELWLAPTLQNLPVRIVIRQDAETHVDLQLERAPQQAERAEPAER
jgi:hypothetical protein